MRIEASSVAISSSYSSVTTIQVRESLRAALVPEARTPAAVPAAAADALSLSEEAKVSWPPVEEADPYNLELDLDSGLDPETRMLKALVERLFGVKIELLSPKDTARDTATDGGEANPRQNPPDEPQSAVATGAAMVYDRQGIQTESETATVNAKGVVQTSDGKSLGFSLSLTISRTAISQSRVSLRAGAAAQDPLVVSFAGTAEQLTDVRFSFELKADGSSGGIACVGPASGMLVLDRDRDGQVNGQVNGQVDGQVNDGSEIFGSCHGNGFPELTARDAGGSGKTDAVDPVFDSLLGGSKNAVGRDSLSTPGQRGVGAVYLNLVASQFDLKGAGQSLAGQVRRPSLYVGEPGTAGSVQQVDLMV